MALVSLGTPIPEVPHAISVQLPTWKDMCGLGLGESNVLNALENGYPRSFLHKHIQTLFRLCQEAVTSPDNGIVLFLDPRHAEACKDFLSSHKLHGTDSVAQCEISLFSFGFGNKLTLCHDRLYRPPVLFGVAYPQVSAKLASLFWRLTGTGISSRLAERCLQNIQWVQPKSFIDRGLSATPSHPVYKTIRTRIADLVERAPAGPPRATRVTEADVFLYPSGMSAIYQAHEMLLRYRGGESVVIGFPYELTPKLLETYGQSFRLYSFGTDQEVDEFEEYLRNGAYIQAVWCECPSNPLLRTSDLERIRKLADAYGFLVVIDETIGSFANVDVLGVADIVVTSLSKSFNGYADLLAGSIVLNPSSPHYLNLHKHMNEVYANNLYIDDVIQLEINSRNFLTRVSKLNQTAEYLVDYLYAVASNPESIIDAVYYPKVCWTAERYRSRLRRKTEDFTPGYGCLFTIEFQNVERAKAFFDALKVFKGPSLGANITLAQPYVQMVLQRQKAWAARQGLRETIVRISVGLEDKESLLERVKWALEVAQQVDASKC